MSLDISPFTDEQWWKMCDVHLALPVPLAQLDRTKPFVYDRKWGVMYCPAGYHQAAMGLLLAFHHGSVDRIGNAERLGIECHPHGEADRYLESIPGTAFKSSMSGGVKTWGPSSLTVVEKRLLGHIDYLDPLEAS